MQWTNSLSLQDMSKYCKDKQYKMMYNNKEKTRNNLNSYRISMVDKLGRQFGMLEALSQSLRSLCWFHLNWMKYPITSLAHLLQNTC